MVRGTRLEWHTTAREHVLEVRVLLGPGALTADLLGRGRLNQMQSGSAVARLVDERVRDDEAGEGR
jgi:hypothetical protein